MTSRDDNDICNIGSINLGNITAIDEFAQIVDQSIGFLLCGTLYSKVPYNAIGTVRDKNRRLGLGLMGMHEWLLQRGKRYGPDAELAKWLAVYRDVSSQAAQEHADRLGVRVPVKTRSIAPTGTLSILAETTSGIEPIFCVAYKRRFLKGDTWRYQYVIDGAAQRLIDKGINPDAIEDAYSIAEDVERRIAFQAFVQEYVDHGISSTINLPPWGTEHNNESTVQGFGDILMRYLPQLRGITCYPDGARGGQPLTRVSYHEAVGYTGVEYEENTNCVDGVCGV